MRRQQSLDEVQHLKHVVVASMLTMVFFLGWLVISPEPLSRLICGLGVAFMAFVLGDALHHCEHTES